MLREFFIFKWPMVIERQVFFTLFDFFVTISFYSSQVLSINKPNIWKKDAYTSEITFLALQP